MVKLRLVYKNYRKYIKLSYEGDTDLIKKYHVEVYDSYEEAVEEEISRINIVRKQVNADFYSVIDNSKNIGYVCVFPNNLFSFCININYRSKEILIEFWDRIKEVLGNSFICMLYPNNTRAIKFLQKCGMKIVPEIETNCVTLLNI